METHFPIASFIVFLITIITSIRAFRNEQFMNRCQLSTEGVLVQKMYSKFLYSGFVHADAMHLFFNMISFLSFGLKMEVEYGSFVFLLVYFGSIIIASMFALYNNNCNPYYVAVGASGGICGLVLASIVASSSSGILISILVIPIPGIVFAIGFIILSYIGMIKKVSILAHDAHLAGEIAGIVLMTIVKPEIVSENFTNYGIIALTIICVIGLYIKKEKTIIQSDINKIQKQMKEDQEFSDKIQIQEDMDYLLDKVSRGGIQTLSYSEKKRLEEISSKI